uniref:Integrase, catalytic region, zinc finger, CCHC-type, peptidase aspartic, catalytic n=1 Tax=Tanacetum cinerariifolium TaxID=118510 RepID=A0A6L2L2A3_TANCI|nr:integrase, catalytic region, zinc finger, CCHC-type, peptidase aspartic, catalytic [Tanacetum cinerariifolium]
MMMMMILPKRELLASLIEKLKCEIDDNKNRNKPLETSNKVLVGKLKGEIEDFKTQNKSLESSNNSFKEANNKLSETNKLMYTDLKKFQAELDRRNDVKYASKVEIDYAKSKGDLISYKMESQKSFNKYTQTINDLNQTILEMKKKLSAHQETISILSQAKEAQIKLYKTCEDKELDNVIALENKVKDLKAKLQDKGIAISELKKLIEKLKGKSVDTKFEKSSVIRQPNAFKSQRPSILGKPTIFSDSLKRKDFSKSKSVTKNNVSNDFSKPVTAQILPSNKKSILKNMNVLAPGMYKLHTEPTQTRTSQLPNDSRKTNKRVSFSTGVIPTTSFSRPQLKSNPMEDRVMLNNSQGKKQDVEDHRRNVKFSKNKTSVTACNDSLNAKTLNVNFVCATCDKCVLNEKHDMCVLKSVNGVNSRTKMPIAVPVSTREPKRTVKQPVAKPLRKAVASEPNQKPRNKNKKLYKRVSKACSWWYPKFTPPGYKWKPKYEKENVNPNLIEIILFIIDSGCSKHMTRNLKLLINFVEKFLGTVKFRNNQIAPILGYGDLVQGAVTIKRFYYVEGLNHNLFSVGQFCDADLEVAFRKSTCYIRDLKRNDLLTGSRGTDLYSITLQDTNSPNPICLMAKATSSQAWLWHHRLSHLNFDTINLLSKNDIVVGLPKLKFVKDHLCSSCKLGKAKRKSFQSKITPSFKRRAEAIATTCFTQNRSLVILRHEKTPYHIINDRKPSVKFFHIFGSLCYIIRDGENLDKMKGKGDACIFVGYSTQSRAYRVFNKRTRVIVETIHVNFDELPQMALDHVSFNPIPPCQSTTLEHDSLSPSPQFVSKSFAESTADAPNHRQQQHSTPLNNHATRDPTYHPLEQVIRNPSQSVRTRRQLESDGEMCMFALTVSRTEPKNIKEAMADSAWIESIQEELHQFDRLDRWYSNGYKHLDADLSRTPIDQMKYHSMVGALMYLTASRPDIMHATCYCARYQAKPTEKHLTAVKRIFRYLKDTIHMGLWYPKDTSFELTAFLDSDHAGCLDLRKSTSGGIQFLGGDKLVNWSSKKQDCTSMSLAEADEDGNPARANIKQALGRSYALSWKPCQEDSLDLPDHKYNIYTVIWSFRNRRYKFGVAASFQQSRIHKPHAHTQAFKVNHSTARPLIP